MYRRNAFLPFGGQKTADYLWRYLSVYSSHVGGSSLGDTGSVVNGKLWVCARVVPAALFTQREHARGAGAQ